MTESVVWLGEYVAEDAVTAIVGRLAVWYRGNMKNRSKEPPVARVLYRPDGSELKRIKIERPKD